MEDAITRYLQGIREYALQEAGYYDLLAETRALRERNRALLQRESTLLQRESTLRSIIDALLGDLSEEQQAEIRRQLDSLPEVAEIQPRWPLAIGAQSLQDPWVP